MLSINEVLLAGTLDKDPATTGSDTASPCAAARLCIERSLQRPGVPDVGLAGGCRQECLRAGCPAGRRADLGARQLEVEEGGRGRQTAGPAHRARVVRAAPSPGPSAPGGVAHAPPPGAVPRLETWPGPGAPLVAATRQHCADSRHWPGGVGGQAGQEAGITVIQCDRIRGETHVPRCSLGPVITLWISTSIGIPMDPDNASKYASTRHTGR